MNLQRKRRNFFALIYQKEQKLVYLKSTERALLIIGILVLYFKHNLREKNFSLFCKIEKRKFEMALFGTNKYHQAILL